MVDDDDIVDDNDIPLWYDSFCIDVKDQFLSLHHIDLTQIDISDVKDEFNRSFDDYDNAYGC